MRLVGIGLVVLMLAGAAPARDHVIAILGDSRTDGEGTGPDAKLRAFANTAVLKVLLDRARAAGAEAAFFTGDLVLGLEHEDSEGVEDAEDVPGAGDWGKKGFIYDPSVFQGQIDRVSRLVAKHLGPAVPFYPLIGNHEAVGPDAVERFARTFGIVNRAPLPPEHLAYTADVAGAHVALLATDYFDPALHRLKEHDMKDAQLSWLSRDLAAHPEARWRFVMAHEPAYSWAHKPKGLDKHAAVRDRFWSALQAGQVGAFFCAHEHLYDRSVHGGIVQVISGGAGAPLVKEAGPKAFYHMMLVDLPESGRTATVHVVDSNGVERDRFTLGK